MLKVQIHSTNSGSSSKSTDSSGVGLQLMTPIRPMLAEACKSIAQALGKCPEVR
jgi:hypothetical protein